MKILKNKINNNTSNNNKFDLNNEYEQESNSSKFFNKNISLFLTITNLIKKHYFFLKKHLLNNKITSIEPTSEIFDLLYYSVFNIAAPLLAVSDTIKSLYYLFINKYIPKVLIKYRIYYFIVYLSFGSIIYGLCQLIYFHSIIYYLLVLIFIIMIIQGYNMVVDNRKKYLKFIRNKNNIFGKLALGSFISKTLIFILAILIGFNLPIYFYMLDSYLDFLLIAVILIFFVYLSRFIANVFSKYYIRSFNDYNDLNKLSKIMDIGNIENEKYESSIFKKHKEARINYYNLIITRRLSALLLSLVFSYYLIFYKGFFTVNEYNHIINLLNNLENNYIAYFLALLSNSFQLFITQIINSDYSFNIPDVFKKYFVGILYLIYVVLGYGTFFAIVSMVDVSSNEKYHIKEKSYIRNRNRVIRFLINFVLMLLLIFSFFILHNTVYYNIIVQEMKKTVLYLEENIRKTLNMEYSEKFYSYSSNNQLKNEEEKIISDVVKNSYISFINKYKKDIELNPYNDNKNILSENIVTQETFNRILNLEKAMKNRDLISNNSIYQIIYSLNDIKDNAINKCTSYENVIEIDNGERVTSSKRIFNKNIEYCLYKNFENDINRLIIDFNLSKFLDKY